MQRNLKLLTIMASLIAVLSVSVLALPAAYAQQQPLSIESWPIIDAIPNPVGINQQVQIIAGDLMPYAHGYGWKIEVLITKPDGSKETISATTWATGLIAIKYTPTQVGTYKLQTHFPKQTMETYVWDAERGTIFPPGTIREEGYSEVLNLVVQSTPVPSYPAHPLPSEYWTRPVDAQLREWSTITGNWLYGTGPNMNVVAPNNEYAPETPHILWAKVLRGDIGALVGGGGGVGGGDYDSHGYKTGDAYEGEWVNPIIISGVLYCNKYWSAFTYDTEIYPYDPKVAVPPGVIAIDLHTGETLWESSEFRVDLGQIYYYDSENQHGAVAYLIDTSTTPGQWKFYEAATGKWIFTIKNVPAGYTYFGPNGELRRVNVDTQRCRMIVWDNTAIPELAGSKYGAGTKMWRPYGKVVDGSKGIIANVSIPAGLGAPGGTLIGTTNYAAYDGERVVGISWNYSRVTVWGLSLKPGQEGTLLFKQTWTPPAEWGKSMLVIQYAGQTNDWKNGVIALWCKEERKFYGFSTENGQFLWSTESEHYLDSMGWGPVEHSWYFAYGHLYSVGMGGILYCYDLTTGKTLWKYNVTDPYHESVWANGWWMWICFIADGKVYMGYGEHSPFNPTPRGGPFVCVDAMTGQEVWRADGMFMQSRWGGRAIIGDSIMATIDLYDSHIYAVGKGPSMVTVEAPSVGVPLGQSILIRGTVMDISPGTSDTAIKLRFPKGVPAVADESMTDWMRYVYKQFPLDPNAKINGVWVSFEAIDPQGNYVSIGGTTTDGRTGSFSIPWTPDKPGLWTLILTFPGSKSYYSSYATTTVLVEPAPPAAPTPATPEQVAEQVTPLQESIQALQPLVTALLVLVIIAIIIGIYNIYALRKK